MRHDWNSLLGEPPLLFGDYTDKYFPPAGLYVTYLADYVQLHGLNVHLGSEVVKVSRPAPSERFRLETRSNTTYACRYTVIATGLSQPHRPSIGGLEHTVGYEDMPLDPKAFTNKTVLILGKGQSAFETANHIYGETARIDMISRQRPKMAFQTHCKIDLLSRLACTRAANLKAPLSQTWAIYAPSTPSSSTRTS